MIINNYKMLDINSLSPVKQPNMRNNNKHAEIITHATLTYTCMRPKIIVLASPVLMIRTAITYIFNCP